MAVPRNQRFVYGQTVWMLVSLVTFAALGVLSWKLYAAGTALGLVLIAEVTAPTVVTPQWRSRLRWLLALALAVFGYVVFRRIVEVVLPRV